MLQGDRLLGVVVILGALAFAASAYNLPTPFFSDPLGPKAFPLLVSLVCLLCGLVMVFRPDPDPEWPSAGTIGALGLAVVVLVGYAYALKPLGFLIPTAIAAAVLSWQINPRPTFAALAGVGLSIGLFVVFKFLLGLGLQPLPKF